MFEIKDKGLLLAVGGHVDEIPVGKFFHGDGSLPLQWGTFNLPKGEELQAHIHKVRNRQFASKTLEFFYIICGKLQCDFYDLEQKLVTRMMLRDGHYLYLIDGGHGFKALRAGTKLIEVKLGPYTSVDEDKTKW